MDEQGKSGSNRAKPEEQQAQGPNLRLFYSLIALAIAAAIAIAAMIVLPFYRQR
jgi:hypothetical protein